MLADLVVHTHSFHFHVHKYRTLYNMHSVLLLLPECGDIRDGTEFYFLQNFCYFEEKEFLQDAAMSTSFFFSVSLTFTEYHG
jgi:hypothetical protein